MVKVAMCFIVAGICLVYSDLQILALFIVYLVLIVYLGNEFSCSHVGTRTEDPTQ